MFQSIYWPYILACALSFIMAKIIMASVLKLIADAGFVRPNFRGDKIPVGAGILFFISSLLPVGLLFLMAPANYRVGGLVFLFALGTMTLLGMVDDVFGSRADSGLKGHIKKMLKGELTTGGLKLATGGFMALVVAAVIGSSYQQIIIDTLVIGLSINAINLMDLRPGRAGKGFLVGVLLLFLAGWPDINLIWSAIATGALLTYLPTDLRARAMMGDTGSNALGATIGITSALVLPDNIKLGYLVFLVVFHLFTEKYSLTKIIEKNKILNYFDQLGRN